MNFKAIAQRLLIFISVILFIAGSIPTAKAASDTDFEKSIAAFPESYKPYLRELHKNHPSWTFTPLITGLDWLDAVNGEYKDDISLVPSSANEIFKSREADDYNASTGKYIEKDSGFVKANKIAISYYMDPRNFLNEQGIFQFENLAFDEAFDTDAIELVLDGSFMAKKKISYLNEKGKTVSTNETYSQVLYDAGKLYNINPCFLAAKILNEVGKSGSGSVTGNYVNPRTGLSLYPGIYNFYNIGATDTLAGASTTPIEKGLSWAKNGTTYQRPWNTPKKSIFGGAEYNAEKYIGKGQHTSYLQRFNVNPASSYPVYTHQYMTALTGAAHPAYSNYQSYLKGGMLDFSFNFVIPVFKNMDGEKKAGGTVKTADSYNQTGTIEPSFNVRQGPSVYHNLETTVTKDAYPEYVQVKMYDTVFTDSDYYGSICNNPYWTNITFSNNSTDYNGYVSSNFIKLSAYTVTEPGLYTPVEFRTNSSLSLRYVSNNPSVATVVNDTTIKFLKTGTAEIMAYDSLGNYQIVKYSVIKNADEYDIKNVRVSQDKDGNIKVSFTKNDNFNYYEVYVTDTSGKILKSVTVSTNSATVGGITANQNVKIYVRGLKKSGNNKCYSVYCAPVTLVMKLTAPKGVTASQYGYHAVKIAWDKVDGAVGYEISTYDKASGSHTKLAEVSSSKLYYLDNTQNLLNGASYQVRAYRMSGSEKVYSDYSDAVAFAPASISVKAVSGIKQSSASASEYTLSWNEVSDADSYEVYRYDAKTKKYVKIASVTQPKIKISGLSSAARATYKVRAVVTLFGKNYRSGYSSAFEASSAPAATTKITQSATTATSYTIKWNSVKNADRYRLYRYDSRKKAYYKVADTTGTSYKLSSLTAGSSVKYMVKAFVKTANAMVYSSGVSYTASTCPPAVTSLRQKNTTTSSYTLTWSKAANATGYIVYRYDKTKKKYVKIANTANTYYKISGKKSGETDKYRVKAYTKTNSGNVYSGVSKTYEATAKPSAVTGLKVSSVTRSSYKLSWNKVSAASGYTVYKKTSGGKYKAVKSVKSNSITISGLKSKAAATYIVKAYKKTSSVTSYGAASSSVKATTK